VPSLSGGLPAVYIVIWSP